MSTRPTHKVAVIGGGPAGLATALALLAYAYDVTVIERTDYSDVRVGEHLPPSGISSLRQLQVPDQVFAGGLERQDAVFLKISHDDAREETELFLIEEIDCTHIQFGS